MTQRIERIAVAYLQGGQDAGHVRLHEAVAAVPGHRKASASAADRRAGADVPTVIGHTGDVVARRSLDFYQALALRLAGTAPPS